MAKKTDVTKSSKKDTGKDQKKKGGIRKYFRELKAEMKKVVWPTRQQVTKNTGVVLSVMVVMALFFSELIQVWVQLSRLSLKSAAKPSQRF